MRISADMLSECDVANALNVAGNPAAFMRSGIQRFFPALFQHIFIILNHGKKWNSGSKQSISGTHNPAALPLNWLAAELLLFLASPLDLNPMEKFPV